MMTIATLYPVTSAVTPNSAVSSGRLQGSRREQANDVCLCRWVSREFETMVYDAFEAILDMPEVALLVADKMRSIGHDHSAAGSGASNLQEISATGRRSKGQNSNTRWAEGGRCSRPFESEQSSYAWSKRGQ